MKTKLAIAAALAAAIWTAPASVAMEAQAQRSWDWAQVAPTQAEAQAFRKHYEGWAVANRWLMHEWIEFIGPQLDSAAVIALYDKECDSTPFNTMQQATLWLVAFADWPYSRPLYYASKSLETSSSKAAWCQRIGLQIKVGVALPGVGR